MAAQNEQGLTRHDIEAKIVKRCWEDEAFRKEFAKDPAGCFTKYLNVPADKLPKIVVHEEQAGTWHIVLPVKPAAAGELSDEDLEKIAGGTDIVATAAISVTALYTTIVFSASASAGYEGVKHGW